ncbi:hypothetical protein RIF29_19217 [Crotalaria pallida]|uniref:Uncharacterized protein n=1 Tax=Crotalaria pallida TaxID=3830 RepID=A0AAN9F7E9_CROPI
MKSNFEVKDQGRQTLRCKFGRSAVEPVARQKIGICLSQRQDVKANHKLDLFSPEEPVVEPRRSARKLFGKSIKSSEGVRQIDHACKSASASSSLEDVRNKLSNDQARKTLRCSIFRIFTQASADLDL